MLTNKKLAFVGSGMMAEAMIKGLLRQKLVEAGQIIASGPRDERGANLSEQYSVAATTSNLEAVKGRDVVVLSTKPQVIKQILPELRGAIEPGAFVLSIAAGVPIKTVAEGLLHSAIGRAMPNTPAQIGEGITVWTATQEVTSEQLEQTEAILGALGETVHVEEEHYLD